MSKKRNRNLLGKWNSGQSTIHFPDGKTHFGRSVYPLLDSPEKGIVDNRNDDVDDDDEDNSNNNNSKRGDFIRQVSCNTSSSSSLSGNEDFEAEATRKVENELQLMNRVLQGCEPIPKHYNKDEYEQWMTVFSNVNLWDDHNEVSELMGKCHKEDGDCYPYRRNLSKKGRRSIYNTLDPYSAKYFWSSPVNVSERKQHYRRAGNIDDDSTSKGTKKTEEVVTNKREKALQRKNCNVQIKRVLSPPTNVNINKLEKVRALSRSEVLSSRWMRKRERGEYSLPHIFSASTLSSRGTIKEIKVRKQMENINSIVLPPIGNNSRNQLISKNSPQLVKNYLISESRKKRAF